MRRSGFAQTVVGVLFLFSGGLNSCSLIEKGECEDAFSSWQAMLSNNYCPVQNFVNISSRERTLASTHNPNLEKTELSEDFHAAANNPIISNLGKFKITEPGLSLSLISTIVYGTSKRWPEIAKWNHLRAPYRIRVGQILLLEGATTLGNKEINERLLNIWRAKLTKREMILRR